MERLNSNSTSRAAAATSSISPGLRGRLFATAKGIPNDKLHDLIFDWTGKKSVKELQTPEAMKVIQNIESMKNIPTVNLSIVKKSSFVYRKGFLTEQQYKCIKAKQGVLRKSDEDLERFITHTVKKYARVEDLIVSEASAVIEGLKALERLRK